MIRTVLALFIFALTLCVMIIYQPFSSTADPDAGVEVTRAATAEAPLAVPGAAPITPAPITPAPVPRLRTSADSMDALSGAVLADLGVIAPSAPAPIADPATAQVVAELQRVTGAPAAPAQPDLQSLVAQALRDGQSDAYIDRLVNEAARAGDIAVPRELVTAEGRVDTATLLAAIVTEASAATGVAPVLAPAPQPAEAPGLEVRVIQQNDGTREARFYTVQPGESLGAIAHKLYGDAAFYPLIFEANRQIMPSPDRVRVGQRLVIPAP